MKNFLKSIFKVSLLIVLHHWCFYIFVLVYLGFGIGFVTAHGSVNVQDFVSAVRFFFWAKFSE